MNFVFLAYSTAFAAYAAIASAVVGAAGTAYSFYASSQQQKKVKKQGEMNNAAIGAEQQRKAAEMAENMRRKAIEQKRFRASQSVDLVASGFDTSTGTPLAIMADTITAQQREVADMGYAGDTQSARLGWEGQQALFGASNQAAGMRQEQTAGLISGIGNTADQAFSVADSRGKTRKSTTAYGNS